MNIELNDLNFRGSVRLSR